MFKKTKGGAPVIVLDKRYKNLKKPIEETVLKLLTLTKNKNRFLEIYLVHQGIMNNNVLAFKAVKGFPRPDVTGEFLGEIYLNPAYIKAHKENLFLMLIHGFSHLLGYDHKKKTDRVKMERKEQYLLAKL